eukprot:2809304-Pyramimonas_sp.AAC.1
MHLGSVFVLRESQEYKRYRKLPPGKGVGTLGAASWENHVVGCLGFCLRNCGALRQRMGETARSRRKNDATADEDDEGH